MKNSGLNLKPGALTLPRRGPAPCVMEYLAAEPNGNGSHYRQANQLFADMLEQTPGLVDDLFYCLIVGTLPIGRVQDRVTDRFEEVFAQAFTEGRIR